MLNVYSFHRPQIAGLIAEKASTKFHNKYVNFVDVFSQNFAFKLPKHAEINDHAIELVHGQQLPYGPIYILEIVKLETLKAYIKINLDNGFIKSSKSPIVTLILFDQKLDGFF